MNETYTITRRNAELSDILAILQDQHDAKYDVVVPSEMMYYDAGELVIADGQVRIDDSGVTTERAVLNPTAQFEQQLATKLDIPWKYVQRMRNGHVTLLDDNVNHWLDDELRNWFVRGFKPDNGPGVARAFLSDRYEIIDHLDVVAATLDGVHRSGINVEVGKCNLNERALFMEIIAPDVKALAPTFLERYRSPNGRSPEDYPHLYAGFVLRNSETGQGAYSLAPFITVEVCSNGMVRTKEAMRKVHLGSAMEEGEVTWSETTKYHLIEAIKGQTTDAIEHFLSPEYLANTVNHIEAQAGAPLETETQQRVERVLTKLSYSESERQGIFDLFLAGGQPTVGGLVNAVTYHAQGVEDPERAYEMMGDAFELLTTRI